jgi:hypothetical protein
MPATGKSAIIARTMTIPNSHHSFLPPTNAVCPSGFVVTGGGYGVPAGGKTVVTLSGEAGHTGWVGEESGGSKGEGRDD